MKFRFFILLICASINLASQIVIWDCEINCDTPIVYKLLDKFEFVCLKNDKPFIQGTYIFDEVNGDINENSVSIDPNTGLIKIEGIRRYSTLNKDYDPENKFNVDSITNDKVETVLVMYYEEYTYLNNIIEEKIFCSWKKDTIDLRYYKPIPSGNWTIMGLDGFIYLERNH